MKRLSALLLALVLFLSGIALAETETPATLYIRSSATALFNEVSGNRISIKFQVTNPSEGKPVKAFTIAVWPLDEDQEDLTDGNPYKLTSAKTVAPGKTIYSDLFYLSDNSSIHYIYIAIIGITYEDGTSVTFTEEEALNTEGLSKGWRHEH